MVIKREILITPLQLRRRLHIYLPDDYEQSGMSYPVIYMYDGHNLFYDSDATYGKCWGLKKFMDKYDKKMIIVGVECNTEGEERMYEYFPYEMTPRCIFRHPMDGRGKIYMDWLIQELIPFINKEYRTIPDREHTMIAGSSMGGLMSLYSVLAYNKYFKYAACLSSSVMLCPKELFSEIAKDEVLPDTRIYMDYGTKEVRLKKKTEAIFELHQSLISELKKKTENVMFYVAEKDCHCEACWEKRIPVYMKFLFEDEKC